MEGREAKCLAEGNILPTKLYILLQVKDNLVGERKRIYKNEWVRLCRCDRCALSILLIHLHLMLLIFILLMLISPHNS